MTVVGDATQLAPVKACTLTFHTQPDAALFSGQPQPVKMRTTPLVAPAQPQVGELESEGQSVASRARFVGSPQ
jgi:hypothetical protein